MIELSLKTDFSGLERSLILLAEEQLQFAASRALNDVARASRDSVNAQMPTIFDRPTPFTDRAAVAPMELSAQKDHLSATVTLRPTQAQYLLHEEIGGTRSPAENLRKSASAIVLPGKGMPLNEFGNIPNRSLATLKREAKSDLRARRKRAIASRRKTEIAAPAPVAKSNTVVFLAANVAGNKGHIGGYFRRLDGHTLTRLTGFEADTHYTPRLRYHDHVQATARALWPTAMLRRLLEAIKTAT